MQLSKLFIDIIHVSTACCIMYGESFVVPLMDCGFNYKMDDNFAELNNYFILRSYCSSSTESCGSILLSIMEPKMTSH